jgi:hypothetical protein
MGAAIGSVIELSPRDFPPLLFRRGAFDECAFGRVQAGISREYLPYMDIDSYVFSPIPSRLFCSCLCR